MHNTGRKERKLPEKGRYQLKKKDENDVRKREFLGQASESRGEKN